MSNLLEELLGGRALYVSAHRNNKLLSLRDGNWSEVRFSTPRGISLLDGITGVVCGDAVRFFHESGALSSAIYYPERFDCHGGVYIDGEFVFASAAKSLLISTNRALGTFIPYWQVPGTETAHAQVNDVSLQYATVLAVSEGEWRKDAKEQRGMIFNHRTGEAVIENLFLPHTPVETEVGLWFLNSGFGELCCWNGQDSYEVIYKFNGFCRGMCFLDDKHVVVGISQGRITAFSNLDIDPLVQPGLAIVDVESGKELYFEALDIQEIFDVQLGLNSLRMAL